MNILHVDSSILGGSSVSRQLSASIVAKLKAGAPDASVAHRDLGASPVPHLSGAYLGAGMNPSRDQDPEIMSDLALGGTVLQEFLLADTAVIGVPFYNFAISSQLKAWIDRIVILGQTFRYTAEGRPEGLAGNKRIILAVARGGFYGPGSPIASFEHAESYLRAVFGFLGIYDVEAVAAEGIAIGSEQHAAAIDSAEETIAALAA